MNRIEFIKTLSSQLSYIMRPEEVRELVDYYDEMILDLMEEGMTEEKAVSQLDTPEQIIDSVKGTPLEWNLPISKKFSPYLVILLILGFPLWGSLGLAGILLVFSLYVVIWCIPVITGALAFAGVAGGLASTILSPLALMDGFHIGLTQLGIGLMLFGAGLLITLITISISKRFVRYSQKTTNYFKEKIFHQRGAFSL
ncbi:DUF1700 domain-containing protein [Marinilactibacillus sp. Marseille-P9653]|uniref:DUF1700 domain-containing protein n=1 Tax=Marinilactibacillus sp. Marseille-P9653 TaxID=2866583 RepID=UPI001CE3BF14|nr:DUF1700 domain-containing protein [Marinilactibacillus sp. Marseille-P9653]